MHHNDNNPSYEQSRCLIIVNNNHIWLHDFRDKSNTVSSDSFLLKLIRKTFFIFFFRFSRISFLNQSVGRKKKFKIYLEYKNDELANDFEYDVGVECEGKKYLGFLPSMEHIK